MTDLLPDDRLGAPPDPEVATSPGDGRARRDVRWAVAVGALHAALTAPAIYTALYDIEKWTGPSDWGPATGYRSAFACWRWWTESQ